MKSLTPNVDLILLKLENVDPDLRAQATQLYFTAEQFDTEMGILAHIIRSDQLNFAIVINAFKYGGVWNAEQLLKAAEGMKRDDFKAKLVQNRTPEELSRRTAAREQSAKVAALADILDIGLVQMARDLNDVKNKYMTQIEEKKLEVLRLTEEMEFEIEIVTNYKPPGYGFLNKECFSRENRRLMEQGSPALLLSNATLELCHELHHKEVLQSHREAYVKRATSCISFRKYLSPKKAKPKAKTAPQVLQSDREVYVERETSRISFSKYPSPKKAKTAPRHLS